MIYQNYEYPSMQIMTAKTDKFKKELDEYWNLINR